MIHILPTAGGYRELKSLRVSRKVLSRRIARTFFYDRNKYKNLPQKKNIYDKHAASLRKVFSVQLFVIAISPIMCYNPSSEQKIHRNDAVTRPVRKSFKIGLKTSGKTEFQR